MGCDIHNYIEVKNKGKWLLYNQPESNRNYAMFEKMAGVRGDVSEAISEPKGLPEDVSEMTKICHEYWSSDAHHTSYLTKEELTELREWLDKEYPDDFKFEKSFGYLFGSYVDDLEGAMDCSEVEDVRLVFWFDN